MTHGFARLVVGASRGIGLALLRSLKESGPALGLARSSPSSGDRDPLLVGDAADVEVLEHGWSWLHSTGCNRHVILTAASLGPIGPVGAVSPSRFLSGLDSNLAPAFSILSHFVPRMTHSDRITVFLGGGIGGPRPQSRVLAYTSSKAAIAALVESVGRDPDTACSVVGLSPGKFATTFTSDILTVDPDLAGSELLESTPRHVDKQLDIAALLDALHAIEALPGLSGRCIAAGRDSFEHLRSTASGLNAFRMRRVDGEYIAQVGD